MNQKATPRVAPLARALVAAGLLAVTGCVQETGGTAGSGGPVAAAAVPAATPLLAAVAMTPVGTSTTVSDPAFGVVRIRLDREYTSAAGVLCRRFIMTGGNQAGLSGSRVACREVTGWSLLALQGPSPAGLP